MKIKKGDTVKILTGKDAGKKGTVIKAFPKENKVIVEGLNIVKRAQRSRLGKDKSQVVEKPAKIHASNVAAVEAKATKKAAK